MICGLLAPAAGAISLSDGAPLASQCHYLGHADGLKNTLTPRETNFYENRFWTSQEYTHEDLLAFAGLLKQADQRVSTLSAGQRRRLALTRLLAAPRVCGCWTNQHTRLTPPAELVDTLIRHQAEAGGLVVLAAHEPVPLADQHLELDA